MNNRARNGNHAYVPWHDQTLARELENILGGKARVVILNPNADGGMPHTRAPNIICIPANYPLSRMQPLLAHEYTHINQRLKFPRWREKLLEEGWFPEGSVPPEIEARCRINPDTLLCRWPAWEGRWIACPVFEREDKPNLRETAIRWWDMQEERLYTQPPSSYTRRYGQVSKSEMEHPFELWAYKEE